MKKKDTLIKLKEQERQLRQELIVDAAREVFSKKTYDTVSMAEIAGTAGIAKSSIYTYFSSQEELYAKIACQDSAVFISDLKLKIENGSQDPVETAVDAFLDYYIENSSQWRMITHFALHGNKDMASVEQLNIVGRDLMDLFEAIFIKAGCKKETRLMAHTLFSCLSGVLIAFRNYPGRPEKERIAHMKRIGSRISDMIRACIQSGQ